MSYEGSDMTLGRFSEAVDVFWIFLAGEQAENQEVLEDQKILLLVNLRNPIFFGNYHTFQFLFVY